MHLKVDFCNNKMSDSTEQQCSDSGTVTKDTNSNNNGVNMDEGSDRVQDSVGGDVDEPSEYYERQEEEESCSDLTLDTLPSEIFLHMCSFLDARFVIHTLSQVCRSFHYLIMDDKFWKVRIAKRWPRKYPAIPGEEWNETMNTQ